MLSHPHSIRSFPSGFVDQVLGKSSGDTKGHSALGEKIPVRAVITDFDGVIGDNQRTMSEAYEKIKAQSRRPNWPVAAEAIDYCETPKQFLKTRELSSKEMGAVFGHGRRIYEKTPMHFLPDAPATLARYSASIPWAVVSNNHYTAHRWEEMGLKNLYPNVPVYDNAKKPATKYMEQALQDLGVKADKDVLMVDDGAKGLFAAAKMGITPVYFGEKSHIILPLVEAACSNHHINMPQIPVVKNNVELQKLVENGIERQQEVRVAGAALA